MNLPDIIADLKQKYAKAQQNAVDLLAAITALEHICPFEQKAAPPVDSKSHRVVSIHSPGADAAFEKT